MKKVLVAMGCWLVLLTGLWGSAVAGDCKLPDTGQTKCYNNTAEITCPQPGEPFYGQDGCYTINPPSYTKLDAQGNDLPDSAVSWVMVRDNVTGLIWEVKTDDHESIRYMYDRYTWQNAQDVFIAELNSQQFGGYSDWRMPTIKELTTIINHGKYDPAINTDYFPNTLSPQYWRPGYWSSTTFANKSDDAWGVSFYSAIVGLYLKYDYSDDGSFVRAVRGDSRAAQNSFVDNGDGTITDTATGLMWQKETAESKMQWENALSYCENLTLAGYNDWRLPNERELGFLVDYSKYGPSIDTIFFPDTVSFYYWSSTTYSLDRRQACDMCFESGHSQRFDKYYDYEDPYHVRAVRGGQSGPFRAEAVNPQSSESFYDSFFSKPDPAGLASGGSFSTTIAADGESRLLLRFFSNEPVSVTVAVEGANPANGSLSDLDGYLNVRWDDTSVTVSVDHPYGEGYVGYAVYRAPRDFTIPGCEDKLTRPASLAINHPGGTETLSLTIRRPPILLSHGLWSSPDVLEDFKNDLWNRFSDTGGKNIDDFIRANDGRVVNAAHFDAGAAKTKSNIRDYLKDLRQRGSTVTQVDYMGHSMGGIWGRLVKQIYPQDVFTYDKGYINKIITVDTPHLGSFLANLGDIILDAADDYKILGLGNIRDVLCDISFRFDHPMCDGAVEDLTAEGCVDLLEDVYLPSHAVVGNKYIDTACLLLSLSDRIPEAQAKAAAKLFKVTEKILKVIDSDWGCENWIDLLGIPRYSDYIVSLTSQKGGLDEPFEVSEFNMWHMGCYNEDVNGEVLDLLNTFVDNPVFADHFDAAGDLVSLEYLMNLEQLKQKAREKAARPRALFSSVDAGIAFVTPSDGEVISPGDTVDVEITTTGGLTLESLLVIDPYSDPVDITSPPYTTSFNVPLDAYGSYSLTALGEGTDGELYGAEVTLDVENPATLVSLEVSPETLFIDTGGAVGISVMGKFSDGSLRDLSKGSTGTTYESGNTGIVTVDANGTCAGISAGTADVTVHHGAQPAVTVAVEVAQPYINAAFTADEYVGPVPLAVNFTDISAGYIDQWQWSFGDGGTSTDRNPSHTYNHAGNYTVTLTVTGPGGSDSDTEVIIVGPLPGDANGDGKTTIDEVQRCINQFLDIAPEEPCNDLNNDGHVTIDEVQRVINAFLEV